MSRVQLDPLIYTADEPRSVDFISKLPSGVSISSAGAAISLYSGNDPNPEAILKSISFSGTLVTAVFTGGVLGSIYLVEFDVLGSDGNNYVLSGFLAIVPGSP